MENMLMSALRVGDKKTVLKIIESIFTQMKQKNLEISSFHNVCIELLSIASRVLCEFNLDMTDVFGKDFQYFEKVRKYRNLNYAQEWMLANYEKLAGYILNTKILKAKKIIETAKRYIDEHYQEELTLNSISKLVFMSPAYFSSFFSNEVGQSFLEYVITRRIEKAKQLLGEKDSKVFEVGEKVGYDNPNYFSRIFKKCTGLSPVEYKGSIQLQENP